MIGAAWVLFVKHPRAEGTDAVKTRAPRQMRGIFRITKSETSILSMADENIMIFANKEHKFNIL